MQIINSHHLTLCCTVFHLTQTLTSEVLQFAHQMQPLSLCPSLHLHLPIFRHSCPFEIIKNNARKPRLFRSLTNVLHINFSKSATSLITLIESIIGPPLRCFLYERHCSLCPNETVLDTQNSGCAAHLCMNVSAALADCDVIRGRLKRLLMIHI